MKSATSVLPAATTERVVYSLQTHTQRQTERYRRLQHTGLNQIAAIISDYSAHVSSPFQEGCCCLP